jgi:hypothetical protein
MKNPTCNHGFLGKRGLSVQSGFANSGILFFFHIASVTQQGKEGILFSDQESYNCEGGSAEIT